MRTPHLLLITTLLLALPRPVFAEDLEEIPLLAPEGAESPADSQVSEMEPPEDSDELPPAAEEEVATEPSSSDSLPTEELASPTSTESEEITPSSENRSET